MFEGNNSGVFIVNFEHVIADWEKQTDFMFF